MQFKAKKDLELARREFVLGVYDPITQKYIYPSLTALSEKYQVAIGIIKHRSAQEHWQEVRSIVRVKIQEKKRKEDILSLIYTASSFDRDTITQIEKIRHIIDAYLDQWDYVWSPDKRKNDNLTLDVSYSSDDEDLTLDVDLENLSSDVDTEDEENNVFNDDVEEVNLLNLDTINALVDSVINPESSKEAEDEVIDVSFDPRAKAHSKAVQEGLSVVKDRDKENGAKAKKSKEAQVNRLRDDLPNNEEMYVSSNSHRRVQDELETETRRPIAVKDIKTIIDCLKGLNEIQEMVLGRNEGILDLQTEISKMTAADESANKKAKGANVRELKAATEDKLKELDKLETYRNSANRTKVDRNKDD